MKPAGCIGVCDLINYVKSGAVFPILYISIIYCNDGKLRTALTALLEVAVNHYKIQKCYNIYIGWSGSTHSMSRFIITYRYNNDINKYYISIVSADVQQLSALSFIYTLYFSIASLT